eukprot:jgi/Phyca11/15238/fgenesh1_pg.PHYCAscaffold_12_\
MTATKATAALFLATASAASLPNGSWPASKGTVQYKQAYIVKAGEVFDGKMKTYERSDVSCQEQTESGADTSVFKVEAGGHLKNVCQWSQGNANGEPKMLGNGPSPPLCQYSTSDIHINQDISKAAGQTPSQEEQDPSQEEQSPTPTTKPLKKTKAPKTTAPKKTKTPEPVEESAEQVDQTVQQTASKTPSNLGDGPSGKLCQYSTSDIHINEE